MNDKKGKGKKRQEHFPQVSGTRAEGSTPHAGLPPKIEGFEIKEKIGHGAMGAVWRALDKAANREIALKVIHGHAYLSQNARRRFEREIELAARLEHPYIARVYESGAHERPPYYTMEFLRDARPLDRYIMEEALDKRLILQLMGKICSAVEYAHQHGVIHRDLKPSNIMVTPDGEPHIVDFGLAKDVLYRDANLELSVDGETLGTPAYMSPEQAGGIDQIGTRSDIYSLGVILYYLLTSIWPYDVTGSYYEVLKNIQKCEPQRPSKVVPYFDSDVEAILLKTLAKRPDDRYRSAGEFADDIERWLEGRPVTAQTISNWYLLKKFVQRHRAASAIIVLLAVILTSSGFIGIYSYSQARSAFRELESRQSEFEQFIRENLALLNQTAFRLFLEFWNVSDGRAKGFARFFPEESRESAATRFLLDTRPIGEKRSEFDSFFSGKDKLFGYFVMGEWFLHNGQPTKAIEAYRACLQGGRDSNDSNEWFREMAKERLAQLLNKAPGNQPP